MVFFSEVYIFIAQVVNPHFQKKNRKLKFLNYTLIKLLSVRNLLNVIFKQIIDILTMGRRGGGACFF